MATLKVPKQKVSILDDVGGSTSIRDKVFFFLELSKRSRVPVLFISNPGLAKSTDVRAYLRMHDYWFHTIIGSQSLPEDILGFNGKSSNDEFRFYTPDWYKMALKKHAEGKKTAIFIDELGYTPRITQGVLLRLIFDRVVGGIDNELPRDTLIIAATNYPDNIGPDCVGVDPPALNRFMICNLEYSSIGSFLDEFSKTDEEFFTDPTVYADNVIDRDKIRSTIRESLQFCMEKYQAKQSIDESLTLNHRDFSELFFKKGPIRNFISGRSYSYLLRCVETMHNMGFEECRRYLPHVVSGLVGAGSGSFNTDEVCNAFVQDIVDRITYFLSDTKQSVFLPFADGYPNLQEYLRQQETMMDSGLVNTSDLSEIELNIRKIYSNSFESIKTVCSKFDSFPGVKSEFGIKLYNDLFELDKFVQKHNLESNLKECVEFYNFIKFVVEQRYLNLKPFDQVDFDKFKGKPVFMSKDLSKVFTVVNTKVFQRDEASEKWSDTQVIFSNVWFVKNAFCFEG